MKKTIWTDDSIAYLKENYPHTTDTAIAQHLCVNRKTVSLKAKELGLEKGIRPEWLDLAERVRELHGSHSNAEIAAITGISSRSVSRIVAVLCLRRTKKEEQSIRSRIRQDIMKREKRRVIWPAANHENKGCYKQAEDKDAPLPEKGRLSGNPWSECHVLPPRHGTRPFTRGYRPQARIEIRAVG